MATPKAKFVFWFMALVMVMACVPGTAAPAIPTIDPNAVGTYIAQTSVAAATQTAAAIPTSSPTATFTSTPRFTDTPEPTATSTIIFIFFSPTAVVTATSTGSNATGNREYACQIIRVTPANGTAYDGRTDFDAKWTVRNSGRREWDRNSIDYLYINGDRFHKTATYDLTRSVKVGEQIDLIVDMVAPKDRGSYSTNWSMRVGSENFCTLSLTIVVR